MFFIYVSVYFLQGASFTFKFFFFILLCKCILSLMRIIVKTVTFVHKALLFLLKVKENLFMKVNNFQILDSTSDVGRRKLKMSAENGRNMKIRLR